MKEVVSRPTPFEHDNWPEYLHTLTSLGNRVDYTYIQIRKDS